MERRLLDLPFQQQKVYPSIDLSSSRNDHISTLLKQDDDFLMNQVDAKDLPKVKETVSMIRKLNKHSLNVLQTIISDTTCQSENEALFDIKNGIAIEDLTETNVQSGIPLNIEDVNSYFSMMNQEQVCNLKNSNVDE
jgi:hypothetical protein